MSCLNAAYKDANKSGIEAVCLAMISNGTFHLENNSTQLVEDIIIRLHQHIESFYRGLSYNPEDSHAIKQVKTYVINYLIKKLLEEKKYADVREATQLSELPASLTFEKNGYPIAKQPNLLFYRLYALINDFKNISEIYTEFSIICFYLKRSSDLLKDERNALLSQFGHLILEHHIYYLLNFATHHKHLFKHAKAHFIMNAPTIHRNYESILSPEALYNLGLCQFHMGDDLGYIQYFDKIPSDKRNIHHWMYLADALKAYDSKLKRRSEKKLLYSRMKHCYIQVEDLLDTQDTKDPEIVSWVSQCENKVRTRKEVTYDDSWLSYFEAVDAQAQPSSSGASIPVQVLSGNIYKFFPSSSGDHAKKLIEYAINGEIKKIDALLNKHADLKQNTQYMSNMLAYLILYKHQEKALEVLKEFPALFLEKCSATDESKDKRDNWLILQFLLIDGKFTPSKLIECISQAPEKKEILNKTLEVIDNILTNGCSMVIDKQIRTLKRFHSTKYLQGLKVEIDNYFNPLQAECIIL